ncbi:endonuclease [Flavobacterium sp.]|uniref:endonuclease n=1 Tax=Flavobacterium sp. TaxID=239 RepID=UPI00286C5F0C|nr:endonuclease [Flavobacterium sp.]
MKKNYISIIATFFITITALAQNGNPATPYYSGFDWTLTGAPLKNALSTITISKHTNLLSYTPGVWEASKITDLDPLNSANVILVYGFENGTDALVTNDRTRSKLSQGGNNGNWNREHVYAKSLGTPVLLDGGTANNSSSDAGEDAHHLRPADVQWNSQRGNKKFAAGLGNSGDVAAGWYPGDEWKGDIARMMMYMYLRYGNQCLPTGVGTGSSSISDTNMLNLFLQWNVEDPVSQFEDNRNIYHDSNGTYAQGNRNPFIDNPYLATIIWGGTAAENRWPSVFLSTNSFELIADINVYPNPTSDQKINIETENELDQIQVININGQIMQQISKPVRNQNKYTLENLPQGFYFLKLSSENKSIVKKIVIN